MSDTAKKCITILQGLRPLRDRMQAIIQQTQEMVIGENEPVAINAGKARAAVLAAQELVNEIWPLFGLHGQYPPLLEVPLDILEEHLDRVLEGKASNSMLAHDLNLAGSMVGDIIAAERLLPHIQGFVEVAEGYAAAAFQTGEAVVTPNDFDLDDIK